MTYEFVNCFSPRKGENMGHGILSHPWRILFCLARVVRLSGGFSSHRIDLIDRGSLGNCFNAGFSGSRAVRVFLNRCSRDGFYRCALHFTSKIDLIAIS